MKFANLRIMLVNDDGIDAPGLALVKDFLAQHCPDLWVVAPSKERSGASRSISLRQTIEVEARSERDFSVSGTPTDCTLIGIEHLLKDKKPDIVISGINAGSNLGEDIGYSGTCGAAFEAILNNVPAIALSQARITATMNWSASKAAIEDILSLLIPYALEGGELINVNFPDVAANQIKGCRVTHQGTRQASAQLHETGSTQNKLSFEFTSTRSDEPKDEGSDIDAVKNGFISVTPLRSDFTNYRDLTKVATALGLHR